MYIARRKGISVSALEYTCYEIVFQPRVASLEALHRPAWSRKRRPLLCLRTGQVSPRLVVVHSKNKVTQHISHQAECANFSFGSRLTKSSTEAAEFATTSYPASSSSSRHGLASLSSFHLTKQGWSCRMCAAWSEAVAVIAGINVRSRCAHVQRLSPFLQHGAQRDRHFK